MFYVFDNGGKTLDRYTVIDENGDMLGLSETGAGFSEFCGNIYEILPKRLNSETMAYVVSKGQCAHLGKELRFSQLPKELQQHIIERFKQ